MKVLITGVKGQLGFDVVQECLHRGLNPIGIDKDDVDLTDFEAVTKKIGALDFDALIHCAAYTAVDKAEDDTVLCNLVNITGTLNLAKICKEKDVKMLYVSTDYVFSGEGSEPFKEYDVKNPQNVYGSSKSLGEDVCLNLLNKCYITRISWAFGVNGQNFVNTMVRLAQERDTLNVVNDQFGSPTFTADAAKTMVDLILSEKYGIYHVTNQGYCTWFDFASKIIEFTGLSTKVIPVDSSSFPTKAKRPQNSRLSFNNLIENDLSLLPKWEDALYRYMNEKGFLNIKKSN